MFCDTLLFCYLARYEWVYVYIVHLYNTLRCVQYDIRIGSSSNVFYEQNVYSFSRAPRLIVRTGSYICVDVDCNSHLIAPSSNLNPLLSCHGYKMYYRPLFIAVSDYSTCRHLKNKSMSGISSLKAGGSVELSFSAVATDPFAIRFFSSHSPRARRVDTCSIALVGLLAP